MELRDYLNHNAAQSTEGVDVFMFRVAVAPDAKADDLRAAIKSHKGEFCECDPLDGKEHNYIELGGWIGDQGTALKLIGMGDHLGLWKSFTPRTMLGPVENDDELAQQMAGMGFVGILPA